MPASDGANSIFADKAQALISGVMYALVDLRDKGLLKLSTSVIRDNLALETCVNLALRPELDDESRASIQAALANEDSALHYAVRKVHFAIFRPINMGIGVGQA